MVEKRRRKRIRTQELSSSEEERSTSDHDDVSVDELSELSEDESVQGVSQPVSLEEQHPRERLRKTPVNNEEDFRQRYMKLVTEQFGDEIAAMRKANDFGPASIAQLVGGLKQGIDIFSEEQQRLL